MVELPIIVILEIETIIIYPHARTFKFQSWKNKKRIQFFVCVIISHTTNPEEFFFWYCIASLVDICVCLNSTQPKIQRDPVYQTILTKGSSNQPDDVHVFPSPELLDDALRDTPEASARSSVYSILRLAKIYHARN